MYYVLTKKRNESLYVKESLREEIDILEDFKDSEEYDIYKIFITEDSCSSYLKRYEGEIIDSTPELIFYSKLGVDIILPF